MKSLRAKSHLAIQVARAWQDSTLLTGSGDHQHGPCAATRTNLSNGCEGIRELSTELIRFSLVDDLRIRHLAHSA